MFPKVNQKQSFPRLEEEVMKYWKENDTFKKSIETRKDSEEFNFYDGPPFATGTPHYGHILAGTIKDVIPRYQTMLGKRVDRVFGWDCHGLPIENIVEKKMWISWKDDIENKIWVYDFNESCRANVFGYVDEWKKTVERMWRWVDIENDYKTMDTNFMESVWRVFKSIYDKWLVYEGHRVVSYCPRCTTPLSNFEVNQGYKDKQSKTVTVKFKVKNWKQEICYKCWTWIIVKNLDWKILLWKKKSNWLYTFPGWKVECWENFLNTAIRELEEETWIKRQNLTYISNNYSSNYWDNWNEYIYETSVENDNEIINNESDKFEHWKFYDLDFIKNLEKEDLETHSYQVVQQLKWEKSFNISSWNKYILAWTTTPWTLYANLGLAVWKDIEYVELLDKTNWDTYVLAKEKVKDYYKKPEDYEIIREYKWSCLQWIKYEPIFPDFDIQLNEMNSDLWTSIKLGKNSWSVVLGHHVTTETWTWIVHIAPAYGEDDFIIWEKQDLGFIAHIDNSWKTYNLLENNAKFVFDFNEMVVQELKDKKLSINIWSLVHSYPHCWRCDTPLIYRAISAWYVAVEKIRDKMVANNAKTNWTPDAIKHGRFGKWLEQARDWNISRNRYWGSAIPVWQSEDKKEEVCIGSINDLYEANKEYGQITKVIFVRHGRTDYNEKWLMDYQDKARLNEQWKKQAEAIKERFKDIKIDKIYSSPLTRCVDTITPLANSNWIKIEIEQGLKELDSWTYQDKTLDFDWETDLNFDDEKVGSGESIKDLYNRLNDSFKKILKENKWKTVVICSHWEPLVLLKKIINDYDYKKDKSKFIIQNKWNKNFEETYVYSESLQEVDLHKHFVDDILVKSNSNNLKVKKVLWIHGFKRNPETLIDFLNQTKLNLEKEWFIVDTPVFEEWWDINYKNWEKKLDDLDLNNYDTVFTHSMWWRVVIEYILEKKIKIDRLVLVSSTKYWSGTKEVSEFFAKMKHNDLSKINDYVKEIILLTSKDDKTARVEWARSLAKEINWNLIEVNWFGHFNVTENKIIEWLVKFWAPLKRIPEVLDCWFESGSMPYASKHYPFAFESGEGFKFPADFIAEWLDQTRGWFYTLIILSTALFDSPATMNTIVNGIVLAEDGKKMSKSLKNYPDPAKIFDNYWADAMRFYLMNSPVVEAQDLRFSEAGVEEVVKKVILPLWNTYSFFTTYANIDKFKPSKSHIYYCRHGETDLNVKKVMNGWDVDSLLTSNWEKQAKLAWKNFKLSGEKIDVIISSPKIRAKNTAELIAKEIGYNSEIIIDERLNEHRDGVFKWMTHEEIIKYAKKEYNLDLELGASVKRFFKDGKYNKVEDVILFDNRVLEAYKEIEEKYKWKNVLIVAHAWTFRPINRFINDLDLNKAHYELPTINNATIFKLHSWRQNILDKWIISELNKLILDVSSWLDSYKINEATRPIMTFMDNLTNWYIRRSRKRFWKQENDSDKIEAYETLYEILVELSKILSPVMPFVTEHIYRNLTWKESVHLDIFPIANNSFILSNLNTSFEKTAKLINLWLSFRSRNKLRVRQPLLSATIWEKLDQYYLDIIKEELNVKEIIVLEDSSKIAKKVCRPNAKLIWPKFGRDVQKVIVEAKNGNFEELEAWKIKVWEFVLEVWEYEMAYEKLDENMDIESWFGMVIAMDAKLTPELIEEWYARDIVRHIQESRKEANFNVDDRIEIELKTENLELANSIEKFKNNIQAETLSTITEKLANPSYEKEIELEEYKLKISLKKV